MYNISGNNEGSTITVYEDGKTFTANSDHPNYEIIVRQAVDGGKVGHLFDLAVKAYDKFRGITERVTINGSTLYYDHDPIRGALADQIVKFFREGGDFEPLVKFYEKLQLNPSEHSREQLFTWLERGAFTIDEDGDIVMYKGVNSVEGGFTSIHAGPAIVNNVATNGHVFQRVGDVVEMARSEVNHDPTEGCSTGLHASNFDYARNFTTGAVLTVKVNPADVVSVPTDCDAQKVRVCRYTITGITTYEIEDALYSEDDEYDDYEDEDGEW